jgi:hypothetical protein
LSIACGLSCELEKKEKIKMLFGEKIASASENENSAKRINEMDQFPFSALHFLRNRLMPSGKNKYYLYP